MPKLTVPSIAALAASLVAGALAVLNVTSFGFAAPWSQLLTFALTVLAGLGISPLVGPAFRAALHLSHSVSLVITGVLTVLSTAVTTFAISTDLKGILIGVLAFFAGIGFAPGQVVAPVPTGKANL